MKRFTLLIGLLIYMNISYAALNDLGNGLVSDSTLNITWMKDANLVKTACNSGSGAEKALWDVFTILLPEINGNSLRTPNEICSIDGMLNWFEAEAWIGVLNIQKYLGYDNWRQPTTAKFDPACSHQEPNFSFGRHCSSPVSELNYLSYISLNNIYDFDNGCDASPPQYCFKNTIPFENTRAAVYWSSTELGYGSAAIFSTRNGYIFADSKFGCGWECFDFDVTHMGQGHQLSYYVWPVRSGLSLVEQIPTLSIWSLLVLSVLLTLVARRKSR